MFLHLILFYSPQFWYIGALAWAVMPLSCEYVQYLPVNLSWHKDLRDTCPLLFSEVVFVTPERATSGCGGRKSQVGSARCPARTPERPHQQRATRLVRAEGRARKSKKHMVQRRCQQPGDLLSQVHRHTTPASNPGLYFHTVVAARGFKPNI